MNDEAAMPGASLPPITAHLNVILEDATLVATATVSWPPAPLLMAAAVMPVQQTMEGQLVQAVAIPWKAIVRQLALDSSVAMQLSPRQWEELVAGAYQLAGFDEVTLTPSSGDYGRDVIAIKRGVGCVRIIGSVKKYSPGHLVNADDVRALSGVLNGDRNATKGILTTTSDFAPRIRDDPYIAPLIPYRLELMNGRDLQAWLTSIASKL